MPTCQSCGKYVAEYQACPHCHHAGVEQTIAESVNEPLAAESFTSQSPLRPRNRPPVPRLVVLDDDSDTAGEIIRLRRTETRVGRFDCDVSIGQDADISGCHVRILREQIGPSRYQWRLFDNRSTNGTFVRRDVIELGNEQRFLVGGVPVRWRCSGPDAVAEVLVDTPTGPQTFRISARVSGPLWWGRDPQACWIVIEDPRVADKHALLQRQAGGWQIQDQNSRNGLWVAVEDCILIENSYFLLGEQRFLFQIPGGE